MKHSCLPALPIIAVGFTVLTMVAKSGEAAPDLQGRSPAMDPQGHFWVYRNGTNQPFMPFVPYGWMSDATNLTQIIKVDLECRERPNAISKPSTAMERERCIKVQLTWGEASWASIAFISGPDRPPWWGQTKAGRHYNLGSLPKKKLVFYARGERGGEIIKAQIGTLNGKPFGDSLEKPLASEELKLTKDWTRFEMDLKDVPVTELARICSGFGVLAERANQPDSPTETQFYLDDIYYE